MTRVEKCLAGTRTELARRGVHPRIIRQRAGHSSLVTTQLYIEVTPDQEREAVRSIRF